MIKTMRAHRQAMPARRRSARRRSRLLLALATFLAFLLPALLSVSSASAYQSPAIWVGSPVSGTWGVPDDGSTTPSGAHHMLVKASPQNDWSVDLPTSASGSPNQAAYLYVAPSNSGDNANVTTRVLKIIDENACRYGGGGDLVTVGIYFNGTSYGQVTYAHLDRNPDLYEGQPVDRWGTWLGNVADLWAQNNTGGSNCWTGPHVHAELRATTQYSCWNRGYSYAGYPVRPSNFLGFVSGPLNYSGATPCP